MDYLVSREWYETTKNTKKGANRGEDFSFVMQITAVLAAVREQTRGSQALRSWQQEEGHRPPEITRALWRRASGSCGFEAELEEGRFPGSCPQA